MSYELLISWILIIMVGNALPGADFFCITSVSLRSRRLGLLSALGLQTGVLCQSLIACFGTITIAHYNQTAFEVIQLVGSGYLLYLAYAILSSAYKRNAELKRLYAQATSEQERQKIDADIKIQAAQSMSGFKAYRTGFLTNIFNPKCFIFMATVLPQFVDVNAEFSIGMQMFILCAVNLILGLIHWTVMAYLVSYLAQKFSSASFRLKLEMIGGYCLLIIGLLLLGSLAWQFNQHYFS
ncbi:hypothetical protein CJP74_07300 [Psittacicella melopsittaci]|uniref:Uncharacterized protein n=1 Tax=Psittacicella melopsittaci TaxID=2028576 RepID=A0A3A1Y1X0_9GAMM|nr:LysE family translocator [Psittacicella melopsittaci]RIY31441.1 hypothetical protein CJP74_07300 [Psittacicella melopsittaci]